MLSEALKQAVRWEDAAVQPTANVSLPQDQRPESRGLAAEEADRFVRATQERDLLRSWREQGVSRDMNRVALGYLTALVSSAPVSPAGRRWRSSPFTVKAVPSASTAARSGKLWCPWAPT